MTDLTPAQELDAAFADYEMRSETGGYDWTTIDLDTIEDAIAEAIELGDASICVGIPSSSEVSLPIATATVLVRLRRAARR